MNETCALLRLHRLRVQNANAVSGPLSWGFPSPTAFAGFPHALQRKLGDYRFGGVGIVCHRFEPQVDFPDGPWRPGRFRLARHPYIAGYKKFNNKASAIVEEGRAHMEVSLLIEVFDELVGDELAELARRVEAVLPSLRLAGGSLLGWDRIEVKEWPEHATEQREHFRKLRYRLLPGFALVERRDLLEQAADGSDDPLSSFLDSLALTWAPPDEENGEWHVRSRSGWIVPVPVGYAALSELHDPGQVAHTRDAETPFRFVESLYTLGQWLGPHRLNRLEQLLWHTESRPDEGIYLCRNRHTEFEQENHHV